MDIIWDCIQELVYGNSMCGQDCILNSLKRIRLFKIVEHLERIVYPDFCGLLAKRLLEDGPANMLGLVELITFRLVLGLFDFSHRISRTADVMTLTKLVPNHGEVRLCLNIGQTAHKVGQLKRNDATGQSVLDCVKVKTALAIKVVKKTRKTTLLH